MLRVHIIVMIPTAPMDTGGDAVLQAPKTLATDQMTRPDLIYLAVQFTRIVVVSLDIDGANSLGTWRRLFANTWE